MNCQSPRAFCICIPSDGFTCMILSKDIIKNCLIVLWLFFFSPVVQISGVALYLLIIEGVAGIIIGLAKEFIFLHKQYSS